MVLPKNPVSTIFFIEKSYKQTKKYIFTCIYPPPQKTKDFYPLHTDKRNSKRKARESENTAPPNKPKLPEAAWIKGLTCLGKAPSLPG